MTLSALCGCGDFDRIDFQFDSTPPVDVYVTFEEIRIPEGVAVITTARPMAGDSVMARETSVELKSTAPDVMGVAWALPPQLPDTSERPPWSFVLFGVAAGSTTVTVRIDGEERGEIPTIVEVQ
jgi:hypothetical protein